MSCATSALKQSFGGFAGAIVMAFAQVAQAATPQDAIVGTWLTEDGGSKVDVVAGAGAWTGGRWTRSGAT